MPKATHAWSVVPLLRRLRPTERDRLLTEARSRSAERGDEIAAADVVGDSFAFVTQGALKVTQQDENGRTTMLHIAVVGQLLEPAASWLGHATTARLVALVDHTSLLLIRRKDLMDLVQSSSQAACALLDEICRAYEVVHQRALDMAVTPVPRRIARLVDFLSTHHGVRREDGSISIPFNLSRQDLADLSATTIETTIRVLSRLQANGIVATERSNLVISDVARLQQISAGTAALRAR